MTNIFETMGKSRYFEWVVNILLVVTLAVIGLIFYWELYPYEIIDWKIDQFQTIKQSYTVEEPLTYRTAFCKEGDYIATQIRRLEDGVVYLYPDFQSSTREGCYDFVVSSTIVPNVSTGEYIFELELVFKPNPIREIHYTMRSNSFKIVNSN